MTVGWGPGGAPVVNRDGMPPTTYRPFVDVDGFLAGDVSCLRLSLAASQIHELQRAHHCVIWLLAIDALKRDFKHRVRSTA